MERQAGFLLDAMAVPVAESSSRWGHEGLKRNYSQETVNIVRPEQTDSPFSLSARGRVE